MPNQNSNDADGKSPECGVHRTECERDHRGGIPGSSQWEPLSPDPELAS